MIDTIYKHFIKIGLPVSTDSRNIIPGSIFFALKGDNFDGNKYANDAITKGASLAVIDNGLFSSERTILVKDTLVALQDLAAFYRKKMEFKVLALTGTNGKTTTKELVKAVLSEKFKCHATKGNLNNHIGVPLTILSAPKETDFLIVEMGANHLGEIDNLCQIAQPDFGLITNIGKAHLEGFGGFDGVIKAKSELYNYLKINVKLIFANSNDELLLSLIDNYKSVEFYGTEDTCCYSKEIKFDGQLSSSININGFDRNIKTYMFGRYNITNVLAAIKIGLYFGVDEENILKAVQNYIPENNRSQILKTSKNTLILDSYNANPSSMKIALESFSEIESENKITILGEMKELGDSSLEEHESLIKEAKKTKSIKNIYVGNGFQPFSNILDLWFSNTMELVNYLKDEKITDKLIFIKGSRTNQLEKIIEFL